MILPQSAVQLETWTKTLPDSRLPYPRSFSHRLKYIFWRLYTPYHPFVRDTLIALGFIKHEGRQDFLLGKIAPEESIKSLTAFLIGQGYGNHFIAWQDEGEVVGLRLVEDFVRQYHLRIFADGEVRGHYEYTPECYPVLHIKGIGMEDRNQEFLNLLGNRLAR